MRKREKGTEWVVEGGILYEKEAFGTLYFFLRKTHRNNLIMIKKNLNKNDHWPQFSSDPKFNQCCRLIQHFIFENVEMIIGYTTYESNIKQTREVDYFFFFLLFFVSTSFYIKWQCHKRCVPFVASIFLSTLTLSSYLHFVSPFLSCYHILICSHVY